MAISWMSGFFIPLIEIVIVGGVILWLSWIITRAFLKVWRTRMKWFFKYSLFGRKYPEKVVEWNMDMINMNMDYWKTKQHLLLKNYNKNKIDEILWIYLKVLNKLKGGFTNHGRPIERSFGKTQSPTATELPKFKEIS